MKRWLVSSKAINDALGRADRALYAAKHAGRNRVVGWEPVVEPAER